MIRWYGPSAEDFERRVWSWRQLYLLASVVFDPAPERG